MKEWFIKEFAAASEVESMPLADIYDNEETQYARKCQKIDLDTTLMENICAKADVGENTLFCAALGMTLSKYCGDDAVLYSIADSKGSRVPVFHNLANMSSVAELLQQTRKQNDKAREYSGSSLDELCDEIGVKSNIVFRYEERPTPTLPVREGEGNDTLRYDNDVRFVFVVSRNDGGYNICLEYQENKYSQDFIDGFCDTYEHILNELCTKELLSEVSCCNEKMIALLDSFKERPTPALPVREGEENRYDNENGETILSLFKGVARQYPDNIAVVFKEKRYTYRELDELTDKIGALIYNNVKDCGKAEPVVSIIIPKNEYIPILPLAAMKAGCAYQPLDPSYPQERLNFMVKDADAALLIADDNLRGLLNEYEGEVILTGELGKDDDTLRYDNDNKLRPDSLFILLYTSGSTGVPKGVMLEHQNIVTFTNWYRDYYEFKPEHNVAAYASFGFDANMMDLYPTLTTGATVHIIPEEIRLDLVALNDYFEANNITHTLITTQVGVQFLQNTDNHSLRHLSVGGEKLVSVDPPKGYTFHNAYGPTECTILSTIMPVLKRETNIPIGKPTSMLKCYVMDKQMHRLPVGAAGELVIVGKQVGRGYLNRPDKTAEAFFTMDDERAYHSGDIVRYRKDGNIEFVGRKDGQVKIRGFRIELKEVETVIRDYAGIKDVTVQAFDDANGGKFIAAYIVSDDAVDIEALNSFILDQKPPYMVPAVTMQIEKIPLNVNQKVDKKALPKPEKQLPANDGATANVPLNAFEKELKAIIASVVNTEDFGITDILGYVGLTSISGIKLATLIYKKYGVQINAKTLAKTGTLQSIENEILIQWMRPTPALPVREGNDNDTRSYDNDNVKEGGLSFPQQGVYAECMANPGSILYNLPDLLTFPEGTTAESVKAAVAKVLAAHPYMTCHFISNDRGEVVQLPIEGFELEIPVTKMTAEAFEKHKKDITRPFDLSKGPLFRFEIFEVENGAEHDVVLFSDIHHLIGDGASLNMIYQQICQALDGEAIEAEEYDYYQFVRDQVMDSTAEAYFDRTIGGVEEVSRLLPDIYEDSLDHHQRTISVGIPSAHIEEVCHRHGITPAAFFLAAASLAVSRYLCEEEVTMITISNGRSNLKVSDTAGMFVNTLPLALHVGTGDSVASLLQHASSVFEEAIDHETYPFARVASKYGFTPQISYACQMGVIDELTTSRGEVKIESLELDVAKVPMAMFINGSFETGLTLDIDYDSSLYSEVMMRHFADSVVNVAESFVSKQELKEISLTTEKEWTLLDSFNAPLFTDYDHTDTVVSLFQKHVEEHPDKMAAIYGDKRYTYRQLDEATDILANIIYDKVCAITGKKDLREEVVSIIIDRNEWVFLLPLAVLKTGCAYEPLDPSYPSDRLNYMVQDAQAHLLIGQPELTGLVSEYDGEILLTTDLEACLKDPQRASLKTSKPQNLTPTHPSDLLLMLYTSGSTGKPKGVQIEHHSLVTFAHGISKADFYTHDCVAAAYASFGFDVCMMDTFCTLLNGGTLVIIPESMRLELKMLAEYMESEHVTQIFMTTQVGVQFLQNYPSVKHLRYLGMGGEKLPAVNPEGLSYKILNGYGPTENTCGVSLFPIKHWEKNIPLGRPFPTIQGYILDKAGHRLPPGACGEYCVAGDQPARGYLGLPEKTAEVFVEYKGLRMYHTGDIVRYRENGDVEFVGRKDGMVKIRGFRIELKEVEAAIRPFEGVEDVTVQAYDYDGGGKYLAAFVVTSQETLDTEKLLAYVKEQKPPYMVPAIVMQIDHIPLTVNQKVDKKALPKPQMAAAAYVAPKNKIEEDICNIFGEVLGLEKVSAASDFFELGGSSIIALKVVIAADKKGYSVVYNDIFAYPTAQDMAEHLVQTSGATAEAAAVENTTSESTAEASVYGPGTKEISPDGFDYRSINALLRGNTMEAFMNGEQQPVGDVLLAGATGYLGIHVLKDLIDNFTGKIYCFVRGKGALTAEKRLKTLLYYYFESSFSELFVSESNKEGRIHIVEGDATDPHALDDFNATGITVVNCAACVKHFSKGNEIEQINVGSVRNLILWCIKSNSRLVHVSTGSVMGSSVNNVPPQGFLFNESMLYVGQLIDNNQYVSSKFMAERIIYDAILHHGLNAKVMRVGNLAPRDKDGEFQINFRTNNFMATLAAYTALGMIPYSDMDSHIEFSPIDKVARSILLLASTPRECVCFMPSNHHRPHMGDVVMQLAELGYPIRMVENEEFQNAVQAALNDPAKVDKMRPFMVYEGSMTGSNIRLLEYDDLNVNYTTQVLYRLGFRWPTTTEDYVRRFLAAICGLNFFD